MTYGWHYAEGKKTVGPLDLKEMQTVLSQVSDPRNLRVWRVGFKDWERAGNVQELAGLIDKPPPPPLPKKARLHRKTWAKVVYGIGLLILLMGLPPLGAAAALAVIFTLDDIRT